MYTSYVMRDARCAGVFGSREPGKPVLNKVCGNLIVLSPSGASWAPYSEVTGIAVEPGAQRGKLGVKVATKLYEAAAKDSCKRWKAPLASDTSRSANAEAFWYKQMMKGRAQRIDGRYILSCPAPKSLARYRRR
jgi:ribosomal protein S18 acetylase RimI-like enzyme